MAGLASTKEEEHDADLSGPFVVGGGGVEAGDREGEGCSFISFCPAYARASAASTLHLLIVFKGRGGVRVRVAGVLHPAEGAPGSRVIDVDEDMRARETVRDGGVEFFRDRTSRTGCPIFGRPPFPSPSAPALSGLAERL
jgi:hypothetical protein